MPKPGYRNLTIKEGTVKVLEKWAQTHNMSVASLVEEIVDRLAPAIIFTKQLNSEVLKVFCAKLYYHLDALSSIVSSLLGPSPVIDLKLIRIYKVWDRKPTPLDVLSEAGIIDSSNTFDIIQLIQDFENAKKALRRAMDKTWPGWMSDVEYVGLIREIVLPEEYLEKYPLNVGAARGYVKPIIDKISKVWDETLELVTYISTQYSELKKIKDLTIEPLKRFATLFKLSERKSEPY